MFYLRFAAHAFDPMQLASFIYLSNVRTVLQIKVSDKFPDRSVPHLITFPRPDCRMHIYTADDK